MNLEHQPAYRAAAPRVLALALATGMSVAVSVADRRGRPSCATSAAAIRCMSICTSAQ
ncbi:MAG: Transcriptional regulator, IclR family [uncultured Caballeronia sp.]|nr:MAG: Transcriptional regulator, IclR family [uncultured Caballeronia sp.]